MKIKKSFSFGPVPSEIVAKFGRVHLITKPDGNHFLTGGNAKQSDVAREWCSQHTLFVTLDAPPPQSLP